MKLQGKTVLLAINGYEQKRFEATQRLLKREGAELVIVNYADEVMPKLQELAGRVHVVMMYPEKLYNRTGNSNDFYFVGFVVADEIKKRYPTLPVILFLANLTDNLLRDIKALHGVELTPTWIRQDFLDTFEHLLQKLAQLPG